MPEPTLTFIGTGEALDPELPNTSLLVEGPRNLLLDCGYAIPHALWRVTRDPNLLDGIWISHTHADHCFGLPALLLWMRLAKRQRPLTVLTGPGVSERLEQVLELGYPNSFAPHKCYPIEYVELHPAEPTPWGPLELRVAPTIHSLANWAVRIEGPGMRSLVYSGDGSPSEQSRALYQGASVLVHECFTVEPIAGERKHGDLRTLLPLARDKQVETLALLHFAAEQREAIRERALAEQPEGLEVLLPRPGDRLSLGQC